LLRIGTLITRLMSHYWTANDSPEARQMQIEDWVTDLREFGAQAVGDACDRWRRQPGGRRPTPGDIRTYCLDAKRDAAATMPVDEETYARSIGWASAIERRDAIARERQRQLDGDWNHPERGQRVTDLGGFKSAGSAAIGLGVTAVEIPPYHLTAAADPRVQARLREMERAP
jgi:hypothetical protein